MQTRAHGSRAPATFETCSLRQCDDSDDDTLVNMHRAACMHACALAHMHTSHTHTLFDAERARASDKKISFRRRSCVYDCFTRA